MELNKPKIPKIKLRSDVLKRHSNYTSLLQDVMDELKKIPMLSELRMSKDLTLLVCIIAEEIKFPKSKDKTTIDKKTFVTETLTKIFDLTEAEQTQLQTDIDFICANQLQLRKYSLCERVSSVFF